MTLFVKLLSKINSIMALRVRVFIPGIKNGLQPKK